MLSIIMFGSAGEKCYQLENPEILATKVSSYTFQKCWREMLTTRQIQKDWRQILANICFRNADDGC